MFNILEFRYVLRILLAGVCGIVIGIERKNRSKEAGVRTHFIVACGAALLMVISKYAFFDMTMDTSIYVADVRLDPSRVASTIASGIGFLGAGMIFVHKNTITGLTTAAGIWATSGVGMAIGAGMYTIGTGTTFIILIAQLLLHVNFSRAKKSKLKKLIVKGVLETGYQNYIMDEFDKRKIYVQDVSVSFTEGDEGRSYVFALNMPLSVNEEEIITLAKYNSSIKSSV